jgi:hypothetical protein
MNAFSVFAVVMTAALAGAAPDKAPPSIYETHGNLTPQGRIDELVFSRLRRSNTPPANLCSDGVFVRRAYLDVIGTLPTAEEARKFLRDQSAKKRGELIDQLLERKEFADYWAMKWSDLLRVKAEFPINLWPNAAQAYHHWIRDSVRDNKPYDRFVRELLTQSGSNFRVPQVNFYRAVQNREPEGIAQAVALTFMGSRAEKWPKDRLAGMAVFFSQIGNKSTAEWKEEIIFFDPSKAAAKSPGASSATAVYPDGTTTVLPPDKDPREVFANWLITAENPWFARNIVNRIWYWLLGRGIIHEPDDIRPDNPPQNPELLTYLQKELISSHYDLKHIYRQILTSKTYQLSSVPRNETTKGENDFGVYPVRRLEAEVLIDALCQITGTTEKYSSPIPEPFTYIPEDQRSIALEDGSISSSFLELFGRSPRDTGMESERNNRPTPGQSLHLLNSTHIQRKIEQSKKLQDLFSKNDSREMTNELYLTILSRLPTNEELRVVGVYSKSNSVKRREIAVDLAWALINSAEFLYRH